MELLHELVGAAAGRRALVEVVLLGATGGALGVWVLALRQSFAAEAASHVMLPGLVAATAIGAPLGAGAAVGAAVGGAGAGLLARERRLEIDGAVAITVTGALGLGSLLAFSGPDPERLEALLFGDLSAVTLADLLATGTVGAAVLGGLLVGRRALVVAAFDPLAASALGHDPRRTETSVLVALGLTLAVGVAALGSLLALALVVGPAAAARRLGRGPVATQAIAGGLGVAAGVGGLAIGRALAADSSATIALLAVGFLVVTAIVARVGSVRHRS